MLEVAWSSSLLKQGCLELRAQHHVQMAFEPLRGERATTTSLGSLLTPSLLLWGGLCGAPQVW